MCLFATRSFYGTIPKNGYHLQRLLRILGYGNMPKAGKVGAAKVCEY